MSESEELARAYDDGYNAAVTMARCYGHTDHWPEDAEPRNPYRTPRREWRHARWIEPHDADPIPDSVMRRRAHPDYDTAGCATCGEILLPHAAHLAAQRPTPAPTEES